MARRYSKIFPMFMHSFTGGGTYGEVGAAGNYLDGIHRALQSGTQQLNYIAPSWFSNVRKVTFVWTGQWKEGNPARTVDMRLAVMPMSAIGTGRAISVRGVPVGPSQTKPFTAYNGAGTLWEFYGNATLPGYPDTWMYPAVVGTKFGSLATINGGDPVAPDLVEGDTQVLTCEFDRFDPDDAAFFADWDAVAEAGNDEAMVGYAGIPSYVIATMGAGTLNNLLGTGFHIVVTQAPGPINNTCTRVHGGNYAVQTTALGSVNRTLAFRTFPDDGAARLFWREADWDHVTEITGIFPGPETGIIIPGNNVFYEMRDYPDNPAGGQVVVDAFNFGNTTGGALKDYYRSKNLLPFLVNNTKYGWDMRMEGAGGNPAGIAPHQFHIVQKATTKSTFYIECDINFPDPGPDKIGGRGWGSYFDPLFFEDFEDALFLDRRQHGTLRHRNAVNVLKFNVRHDNVLDARDDTPDSSITALTMPQQFHSAGLNPGDNPQIRFQELGITTNDPIQIAGVRKLATKTSGDTFTAGAPGDSILMGTLIYVHTVPLTDSPALGPLFELGAFNPEGCAATSAGLGDHPGLLVITNGSTIPKHFNPLAEVVEDNGLPTPYPDEVPTPTTDSVAVGLDLGDYVYRYTLRNCCTLKESDPNPDDILVDTSGEAPAAEVTLSFAGVRIPGDPQICEICLYRTVEGGDFPVMAKVGCFDPSVTTLFVDVIPDDDLDFINEGLSLLNAPMPCVPVVAEFRNRLFGLGDIPDLSPAGTVSVTLGSDIVVGDDEVEWDRCLEGKFIQVEGDCRFYEIETVLPPASGLSPPIGQLKLIDEYEGSDDTGLNYIICGRPNRLYISEPLEPECWPAANFLDIEPGDGDRLMGAVSNFNRLVICKRSKTYVLTFNEQPAIEVVVPTRISSDIGCIGPRTFAQIESGSVWLSDRGIAIYDGRSVRHVPESDQMNNLFIDPDNPRYVRRDSNGRVIGAVGAFYPKREQYLLLVPTVQTLRGSNLMIVWDIKLKNITLLEFCQEFMSMVVAKDSEGNERVYLGDTNGFVWIYDIGHNDGVGFPNAVGTVRGTITAAGIELATGASFLDDSTATFLIGGLPELAGLSGTIGLSGAVLEGDLGMAGACIYTRAADAGLDEPWQVRTVYAATEKRIYVTPNWTDDTPSAGYDYMIGAIRLVSVFKPSNYGTDDFQKRDWRQVVTHLPESIASQLRIELLPDFFNSDPEELTILSGEPPEVGQGRLFDMSFNKGRQVKPVGRLIHNYQAVRMTNFAPEEPIRILNHSLMVTPKQSK